MNKTPSKTFTIVLIGAELDIKAVTEALDIIPTDSYEKGYQRRYGEIVGKPRSVSMWSYKCEIKNSFEKELEVLLEKFKNKNVVNLHGIERASLHIYLGLSNDDSVIESSYDFVISPRCLSMIQKMGVDVRVTIN